MPLKFRHGGFFRLKGETLPLISRSASLLLKKGRGLT